MVVAVVSSTIWVAMPIIAVGIPVAVRIPVPVIAVAGVSLRLGRPLAVVAVVGRVRVTVEGRAVTVVSPVAVVDVAVVTVVAGIGVGRPLVRRVGVDDSRTLRRHELEKLHCRETKLHLIDVTQRCMVIEVDTYITISEFTHNFTN